MLRSIPRQSAARRRREQPLQRAHPHRRPQSQRFEDPALHCDRKRPAERPFRRSLGHPCRSVRQWMRAPRAPAQSHERRHHWRAAPRIACSGAPARVRPSSLRSTPVARAEPIHLAAQSFPRSVVARHVPNARTRQTCRVESWSDSHLCRAVGRVGRRSAQSWAHWRGGPPRSRAAGLRRRSLRS